MAIVCSILSIGGKSVANVIMSESQADWYVIGSDKLLPDINDKVRELMPDCLYGFNLYTENGIPRLDEDILIISSKMFKELGNLNHDAEDYSLRALDKDFLICCLDKNGWME